MYRTKALFYEEPAEDSVLSSNEGEAQFLLIISKSGMNTFQAVPVGVRGHFMSGRNLRCG